MKLSWLSDAISGAYSGFSDVAQFVSSLGVGFGVGDHTKLSEQWKDEGQKADLRGAQIESVVSGLPYVGDVIRGVEGAQQMEDLYNNTGKTVAYPGSQGLGAGSLGRGLSEILNRKIEDGTHDLYHFYSGASDDTLGRISHGVNNHHMVRPNYYHTRVG